MCELESQFVIFITQKLKFISLIKNIPIFILMIYFKNPQILHVKITCFIAFCFLQTVNLPRDL